MIDIHDFPEAVRGNLSFYPRLITVLRLFCQLIGHFFLQVCKTKITVCRPISMSWMASHPQVSGPLHAYTISTPWFCLLTQRTDQSTVPSLPSLVPWFTYLYEWAVR